MPTTRGSIPRVRPPESGDAVSNRTALKLKRTLRGDESFTGLLIGSTDVQPFLNKTDGEKLVDPTGLDVGVVETDAIAVEAVNAPVFAFTSAGVVVTADETVVQTLDITTNGGLVQVSVGVILSSSGLGPTTGSVFIKRDGVTLWDATVGAAYEIGGGAYNMIQPFSLTFSDTPAAGPHTYDLCVSFSDYTVSPQATARSIALQLFKDAR